MREGTPLAGISAAEQAVLDLITMESIICMLSMMVVIPFAGALSDRVGHKPLWWSR